MVTPYSDKTADQLPRSWQKESFQQQQEAFLQEQARQRLTTERHRQQRQQILKEEQDAESRREQELERLKEMSSTLQQQQKNKEDPNSVDGDIQDNLPTEFNESLFPPASQRLLEAKIGPKALDDYLNSNPQNRDARDTAVRYILRQANVAYHNNTVYSVVIKPKSKIPPSGDIHDYSSLARYFWKNPNTSDGLPYVRLDGRPNPDMDSVWDYRLLRKVFRDCYYMGQAYFWTGEERYAEKIVHRVKQWFLDEETYMNPNLKYGSLIFGHDLGRAQGVLDMFKVYGMFDALKAIEGSKALLAEPQLIPSLQKWFTSYLNWIDNSVQAKQERNAHNNHGTYFTVQYISILEFLGRNEEAKAMSEDSMQVRVGPQIRKDGAQPHETIRPISFFYSIFNLQGLILLAMQAESHGLDLWRYVGPIEQTSIRINSKTSTEIEIGGGTIEDAIRYLSDYAVRDRSEWPYPDSGARNLRDVLKMAKVASLVYGQDRWQELIANLEAKVDEATPGEGNLTESPEGSRGVAPMAGVSGAHTTVAPDDGEPNGFVCELGILSEGTLWHCYK
ncbi:hypothetical protein BG011_002331 [Mortierella polycephala]|uniref:Alginate lyase domain-containing protein n=1 Tax=Mortierella polycephala TaxID=41804 RepID=A0A9P6Q5A0_9FUNG|nr:hypothetical protein BG011_002331 [Mortierella polycephala]